MLRLNESIIFGNKNIFAIEVIPVFLEEDGGVSGQIFMWLNNTRLGDEDVVSRFSICISTIEELILTPSKFEAHLVGLDKISSIVNLCSSLFFKKIKKSLSESEMERELAFRKHIISHELGEWFDNDFIILIKNKDTWQFIWLNKNLEIEEDLFDLNESNFREIDVNKVIFEFLFWIFNSDINLRP